MKSKVFILIAVALVVIAGVVYFFVFRKSPEPAATFGLVSQTTGNAQGLQNQVASAEPASQAGSQVVQILRNLSIIKLDDSVFRNPAFGYLADISIVLPPTTDQGRRNPFAPVGADAATAAQATSTVTASFAPTGF